MYETKIHAPGEVAYEQWVTWKTQKESDPGFNSVAFRHELEFGITDRLQLALYLSDWRVQWDRQRTTTEWRDVAVEAIYKLTDPVTDGFGTALYGEIKGGPELLVVEAKLLLQKNFGPTVIAWNGIIEAEWEGENLDESTGVLGQSLGVSYEISPKFLVGAELLHEVEGSEWSGWNDHVLNIGPNVSIRTDKFWLTVTPLFQVTDLEGEPNLQLRAILGFEF